MFYNINKNIAIFADQQWQVGFFQVGKPSLYRDFIEDRQLNGPFNINTRIGPDLTLERNSSATLYNQFGAIVNVGIDTPRFEYNFDNTYQGLLIEEQRVNFIQSSNDFTNTTFWSRAAHLTGGPGVTITSNVTAAPDGLQTATLLTQTSSVGYHSIAWVLGGPTDRETHTRSIYVKKHTARYIMIGSAATPFSNAVTRIFDFDLPGFVGGNLFNMFFKPVGNGWFRIGFSRPSTNRNTSTLLIGIPTGSTMNDVYSTEPLTSLSGVYIWGAQSERGVFPSSYIPTANTQVVRAADNIHIPPRFLRAYYKANKGTLFFDATINNVDLFNNITPSYFFGGFTTPVNNLQYWTVGSYNINSSYTLAISAGRVPNFLQSTTLYPNTSAWLVAASIEANDFVLYENKKLGVQNNLGPVPGSITTFQLGQHNNNFLNGHIRKFGYWPERLLNSTLSALTGSFTGQEGIYPGFIPQITTVGNLTAFTAVTGSYSQTQTFSVSGQSLLGSITIVPPIGYILSTDGVNYSSTLSLAPTLGTLPLSNITVRLNNNLLAGSYNGNLSVVSSTATTRTLSLTGTVTNS
jgi:hypothetical protein